MKDPGVCPTCNAGRIENGVVSLPRECCAIYFFGAGSWPHMQWKENARTPEERARRRRAGEKLAAERMTKADVCEEWECAADRLQNTVPEFAEVLRSVEWRGRQDYVGDGGYDCCPKCEGIAPGQATLTDAKRDVDRGTNVVGHRPDCALDAALRRAGLR